MVSDLTREITLKVSSSSVKTPRSRYYATRVRITPGGIVEISTTGHSPVAARNFLPAKEQPLKGNFFLHLMYLLFVTIKLIGSFLSTILPLLFRKNSYPIWSFNYLSFFSNLHYDNLQKCQ